jgi:hypothetical protein
MGERRLGGLLSWRSVSFRSQKRLRIHGRHWCSRVRWRVGPSDAEPPWGIIRGEPPFRFAGGVMKDRERPSRRWQSGSRHCLADEILHEWTVIARSRPPWSEMYLDDLTGQLRPVIEELLFPSADVARHRLRLYGGARVHGGFRRRQGCAGQLLATEVAFVEEAIANVLLRRGDTQTMVADVFDLLAPEFPSVERAAYGGFVDWVDVPETGM